MNVGAQPTVHVDGILMKRTFDYDVPSTSSGQEDVSPSYSARIQRFKSELEAGNINMENLKRFSFSGIPDKDGMRAITWKILLGYLPTDVSRWEAVQNTKREQYAAFCEEVIIDPKKLAGFNGQLPVAPQDDHPLSLSNDSKWNAYFKDAEIAEQIDRDVMRTHPDMHFFSGDDGDAVIHREEMKRALFVFAKLNPGLRYVQGMNELYAPLYYQFRRDANRESAQHAEADAFFSFIDLISEFRDHFCVSLDNSAMGIKATLGKMSSMLQEQDEELWYHLEVKNKVIPQFYGFRWITLLLTQEFPFPDVVRLWDTLLSDPAGRTDCLLRLCTAMLLNVREELLQGDFSHNLKMLQSYPPVDVHVILHKAAQIGTYSRASTR